MAQELRAIASISVEKLRDLEALLVSECPRGMDFSLREHLGGRMIHAIVKPYPRAISCMTWEAFFDLARRGMILRLSEAQVQVTR